jgi:hypothetical protein
MAIACATAMGIQSATGAASAHSGPPYPVVPERTVGPYVLAVWADPDTTADGSAAGQFWIVMESAQKGTVLPAETRANVSIAPLDRSGTRRTGRTEPVNRGISPQFVALVMDHEGAYSVRVAIEGPLGPAEVTANVEATYDQRPPPALLAVYLMPFALVGFLWLKRLLNRRQPR